MKKGARNDNYNVTKNKQTNKQNKNKATAKTTTTTKQFFEEFINLKPDGH